MKPSKPQLHTLLLIVLFHAPRHDAIGWGFMGLAAYVAASV